MRIKKNTSFNLIFLFIFIIIFMSFSILRAENMKELPKENFYHKLDIVDANRHNFAIRIKNLYDKRLESLSLESIKVEDGKLAIHSQDIDNLSINQEIEINGKYLSSFDKSKEKEIYNLFERRKEEIFKESPTENINWILIFLLVVVFSVTIAFVFFNKKIKRTNKIVVSIISFILLVISIFLVSPIKKYYTKFDRIKFNYTDKEGNKKYYYGLLNYKFKENSIKKNSDKTETFESNIDIKEELETRIEDVDFKTVTETSSDRDVVVKGIDGQYILNTEVTEGKKGKRTFEDLFTVTIKDNKVISRDKRSETLIKEIKPKDKVVVTGTRPVNFREKIDYQKIYKSDASSEVGTIKKDVNIKPKPGQKTTIYTYNTESNKLEKKETIEKPINEIVLVGVIKYVKESVDFKEEVLKKDDLPNTYKKIIREGQPGQIIRKYEFLLDEKNGKIIDDINKAKLIKEDIKKPVNQIVEVGTKKVKVNEFGLTKQQENYLNKYQERFALSNRRMLNNLRKRNMLSSLYQNSVLDKVARKRNLDNINNNIFAHEYTKNGVYYSAKQDASDLGYAYANTVGENISVTEFYVKKLEEIEEILGSPEFYAEEIIHNYYEDPGSENLSKGHRKTMLTPFWRDIGVDLVIKAVKMENDSYKVKVHGAQIFGVGRVMETNQDIDMFNYYRAFYQKDTKYFVPTRGLPSYESYLQRDSLSQYFNSPAEAKLFRKKSISENNAFNKAISSGIANLSKLKKYEDHKKFYENMKVNNIIYR